MDAPLVGSEAVRMARETLERGLGPSPPSDPATPFRLRSLPPAFDEPRGVFVTLAQFPDDRLRGCVGFPVAVYPLREAVPRAAMAAALEDPRFPPVESGELGHLTVEVSILTSPVPLTARSPADRVRAVDVGRHGLIIRRGRTAGLLLPQVAVDYEWDAEEFLRETCLKAGLGEDAWASSETVVETFQAGVSGERSPRGEIEERPLRQPAPRARPK